MNVLLFLGILVMLIVVHEFGHFIIAKRSGIRVDEFGIFFPPKLFGIKIGETEYTLNLWPIGGFVKIFGENPEKESLEGPDKDRALVSKPKHIQAAVLVGGVFFNVLAAWFLFSLAFAIGTPAAVGSDTPRPIENPVLTIVQVIQGSPAEIAGLQAGDEILALEVKTNVLQELSPPAIVSFVGMHRSEEISVTYRRGEIEGTVSAIPISGLIESDSERYALGISMGLVGTLKLPVHLAVWEGLTTTLSMLAAVTVGILTFFGSALTLSADLSQVAGPVGIVGFVGDAAALGIVPLITFTAFISLNLAVINLLPVPALDGGRLLFIAIEAVRGKSIKPAIANALNTIGFVFLIFLMVAITYNDIARIFFG